ncbi:hypothetical protein LDC_0280 [sediment metagenome]|uniref:Uncharacterized protein n=1 Tax=sediment metagenome TaxID=749907 RepID=D9PFJ8_9ZZZZ
MDIFHSFIFASSPFAVINLKNAYIAIAKKNIAANTSSNHINGFIILSIKPKASSSHTSLL